MYCASMVILPSLRLSAAVTVALVFVSCASFARANIFVSAGDEAATHSTSDEASSVAALRDRIAKLSPSVRKDEAQRLAQCAYTNSRRLAREYRVVWPPGLQNFLIKTGARKRGYCYQWAEDLLVPLDALKLQTLEFHWGESFAGTESEHNNVVVTAKGQPFQQGLLLDCWRYGRLIWMSVVADRHYKWTENKAVAERVLKTHSSR
jgi:hypothetical protein